MDQTIYTKVHARLQHLSCSELASEATVVKNDEGVLVERRRSSRFERTAPQLDASITVSTGTAPRTRSSRTG
jgi:hypothetical protein